MKYILSNSYPKDHLKFYIEDIKEIDPSADFLTLLGQVFGTDLTLLPPAKLKGSSETLNLQGLQGGTNVSYGSIRSHLSPSTVKDYDLMIGYDSEYVVDGTGADCKFKQIVLSQQLTVYNVKSKKVKSCFIKCKSGFLTIDELCWLACQLADVKVGSNDCATYYTSLGEDGTEYSYDTPYLARSRAKSKYPNGKLTKEHLDKSKLPVVRIGLFGTNLLADTAYMGAEQLRGLMGLQGGIMTKRPLSVAKRSDGYGDALLIIDIRDTMSHSVEGHRAVKKLGEGLGLQKIELPEGTIEHMDELLKSDEDLFIKYAMRDSEVSLLFMATLYGSKRPPVSITAAAGRLNAEAIKNTFETALGYSVDYDRCFRGMIKERVDIGMNEFGVLSEDRYKYMNPQAKMLQDWSSEAYVGGLNACYEVGWIDEPTYDYDLQNAYPTAQSIITAVDWSSIKIIDRPKLNKARFMTPFGYDWLRVGAYHITDFEFPEGVIPCIPVKVDGVPVFPRTMHNRAVYCTATTVLTALLLGAELECSICAEASPMADTDGEVIFPFKDACHNAVEIREKEVALLPDGKGLAKELAKVIGNGGIYGKTAQGVIEKHSYNSTSGEYDIINMSKLTNPYAAAMVTDLTRSMLILTMNDLKSNGYKVYSVTTDGFITNAPMNAVKNAQTWNLSRFLEMGRRNIATDTNLWALKHQQDYLLNFTTRGNVGFGDTGEHVCAHSGFVTGAVKDSLEDRAMLAWTVLNTDVLPTNDDKNFPTLKDCIEKGDHYVPKMHTRKVNINFDFKQKPLDIKDVVVDQTVEGVQIKGEIGSFETAPWETIEDYIDFKDRKSKRRIRLLADYLHTRVSRSSRGTSNLSVHSMVLKSLRLCALGVVTIPTLENKTRSEIVDYINQLYADRGLPQKMTLDIYKKARQRGKTSEDEDAIKQFIDNFFI